MLAEAIHSFADCGNQVLLYVGMRQSQREPSSQHPLGYGKITYFWSFIVALMLFSVGGLFSIQEGWHKLQSHEPIRQAWLALLVLGVSIGLETFSTVGCLREINKLRRGRTLRQWVDTTRNVELVVVLGEDLAALVGLVIAFVFVTLATVTGKPIYDAFGSIVIGVVLIIVSLFIAVRIKGLIVGRSAEEDLQKAIAEHIEATDGIEELLNAITLQLGPQVMLAIKVRMTPGISIETAVELINGLERSIKARFPEVAWCFVEPDDTD
jgi:cation diffusion facilitator family transporter